MNNPLIVELLYHSKDHSMAADFKTHTSVLRRSGQIVITENTDITKDTVLPDIVIVFMSAALLADDLINDKILFYKHNNSKVHVIGLRVSAMNLIDHTLSRIQLLPRNSKQTLSNGNIDDRMAEVVGEVLTIIKDIQNKQ